MNAAPEQTTTLARRVRSGALWGAVNVGASRILSFVSTIIVARLLAPEHFGALAVAIVVQTIALNIAELGATAALGRGDRDPDEIAPTVFTIALVTSALLTAAMVAAAPWLAGVLGDPAAADVIRVLAITVALAGLSSVPTAMVWRDFLQGRRIAVDLANIAVSLALVVPMAGWGWGALALAWSRVGGQLAAAIGYWIITPRRYAPGWSRTEAGGILRIGLPLAAANLVVFATLNLDYVVVGRVLDPVALGLYLMAFNLASLPSNVVTAIVRTVAVPAFGRLHAVGALPEQAVRVTRGLSYAAFPISALLIGVAGPLMVTLFGEKWAPAASAMLGLGVFGMARILTELFADLCVGAGRTLGLFWVQVVWLVVLAPALWFGVSQWGIAGAGYAHAVVAWLVVVPVYLVLVRRGVGASASRVLGACLLPAVGAVACAVAAGLVASAVGAPVVAVLAGGAVGLAVYAVVTLPVGLTYLASFRSRASEETPNPAAQAAPEQEVAR